MNKAKKLFVVEGVDRDFRFMNALSGSLFKGKYDVETIVLPADRNIYMLYNILKADDFESDIIEVLRDNVEIAASVLNGITRQDVDEVFLFFDYDAHQNNLNKSYNINAEDALCELINFFDNETEYGKLYISYPMVEALYDFVQNTCLPKTSCFFSLDEFNTYKRESGKENPNAILRFTSHEDWKKVLEIFDLRIQCLFEQKGLTFDYYRKNVTVFNIFSRQLTFVRNSEKIFIFSAFPEFILDYFKEDFFASHIKRVLTKENCVHMLHDSAHS